MLHVGTFSSVHGLNCDTVVFGSNAPLELEGWGELPSWLGEIGVEEGELGHTLGARGGLGVGYIHAIVEVLLELGASLGFLSGGGGGANLLGDVEGNPGELVRRGSVIVHLDMEAKHNGEELPVVSDDHAVGESGHCKLELVLDKDGGDVLSSGSNDELLDASSDGHESRRGDDIRIVVVVKLGDVPGVEPALLINSLGGLVVHVHVPHEDVAATVAELAGVGVDLGLGSRERASAGTNLPVGGGVGSVGSGALGLSEELEDRDVDGGEVVEDLALNGGGSREASDAAVEAKGLRGR
jgi:hypothetical protein